MTIMELNLSYTEQLQVLEVSGDLYSSINGTRNKVMDFEFTDFYEVYRSKETAQIIAYRYVAYVFGTLIFLSNLTVVVSSGLILTKGQQPKSTYILLGNVSLADMIAGIAIIFNVGIENSTSSNVLCIFQIGTLVCPAMVSIFSVGLIAVERYIYILYGMYYKRWFNTTKVRISILFIWIIGIVLGFLPATGWVNNELKYTRCYYVAIFPGALILLNSILSIIPIIVVAVLYSIILVRALRNVKEIKATVKAVSANTSKKPEMRIYRGNGNLGKNAQSVKSPPKSAAIKIKRSFSFNAGCDNKDVRQNFAKFSQKSRSNDDIINSNELQPKLDYNGVEKVKSKKVQFESDVSVSTVGTTLSGQNISATDLNETDKNKRTNITTLECNINKKTKHKEPNKWRAIIIVLLTSGSFIITWMPFFITVIFFVFCEEKLTNPKCLHIRMLLGGPLAVLAFFNSILNPLIYAWWHKGFKRSLKLYTRKYLHKYFLKNTNR